MALIRWDPYRDWMPLERPVQRALREWFWSEPWPTFDLADEAMALDMYETDDALVIKTALPGVRPEDVEVSVQGDMLTIRAERKEERERDSFGWYLREHRYGAWQRTLRLPKEVKGQEAKAELSDGILTITFTKTGNILDRIKIKVQKALPKVKRTRRVKVKQS